MDFSFNDRPDYNWLKERLENSTIDPQTMELFLIYQWTYRNFKKEYLKLASDFNITETRFLILILLMYADNKQLISAEIARKIGATRATTSRLIAVMLENNLIVKITDAKDKRFSFIKITDIGEEIVNKFMPYSYDFIEAMFAKLEPDEKKQLSKLLHKVGDSIEEIANSNKK